MDIMTIIGIIGGFVCIVMSVVTSGGTLGGIWDFPSFIFTVIGSYTALCIAFPMKYVVGVWGILGRTFKIPSFNEKVLIENMVNLSEKARASTSIRSIRRAARVAARTTAFSSRTSS